MLRNCMWGYSLDRQWLEASPAVSFWGCALFQLLLCSEFSEHFWNFRSRDRQLVNCWQFLLDHLRWQRLHSQRFWLVMNVMCCFCIVLSILMTICSFFFPLCCTMTYIFLNCLKTSVCVCNVESTKQRENSIALQSVSKLLTSSSL